MEIRDPSLFVEYWGSIHRRTRRVVECIPPSDLEWRPSPAQFSFGDLVRHIAAIERYLYAEVAAGRPNRYRGHGPGLAQGWEGVLAYYDQLHQESLEVFRSLTPEALEQKVQSPGGPIALWKWLRAMLEHEIHHRGQLYLMLGMRQVPTPPIFGLTSEEIRVP